MTSFEERAKRRAATWGIQALDAQGQVIASAGPSVELARPADTPEQRLKNLEDYTAFLESLDPAVRGPMDRANAPVVLTASDAATRAARHRRRSS